MDLMLPIIYLQFAIVMGPAIWMTIFYVVKYRRSGTHTLTAEERRRLAELKLQRIPRRMPEISRRAA